MGKMTNLMIAGAASVAAMAFAAPASATTISGSSGGIAFDQTSGIGTYSDSGIAAGVFADEFNFNLTLPGETYVDLVYKITSTNLSNIVATFNGTALTFGTIGNSKVGYITLPTVTGKQSLKISGLSGGLGNYAGTITFSAVPEPASWAMMIGGFGIVGGTLRRRSKLATLATA